MSEAETAIQKTEPNHHQKHKRMVKQRIKKWRLKPAKAPGAQSLSFSHLSNALKGYDSSSEEFKEAPSDDIIETLYKMLELDQDSLDMCRSLNTAVFPNESEFRMEEGTNIPTAGSLQQLILYLTHPSLDTLSFQKLFICTIPAFTKPNVVMAALLTRFLAKPSEPGCNVKSDGELKKIRMRISNILKVTWLKNAKYQLENPVIFGALEYFTDSVKDTVSAGILGIIEAVINDIKGIGTKTTVLPPAKYQKALPNLPEDQWDIMNLPEIEVARQITLFHQRMFILITPMDLLNSAWGGKTGYKAQPIEDMTNHFNDLSAYVSNSIMHGSTDPHKRGRIIKRWIDIAYYCYNPNADSATHDKVIDFHAVFSIIYGLTHRSVTRLEQTQKYAQKTNKERAAHFAEMKNLTQISGGFRNYREIFAKATDAVPFMGAFQKDLVYIAEFLPNKIDDLINFTKCEKAAKLIELINKFQKNSMIQPIESIQNKLREIPSGFDTIALMAESNKVEPPKN